jgi:hypothetical protein
LTHQTVSFTQRRKAHGSVVTDLFDLGLQLRPKDQHKKTNGSGE